MGAAASLQLPPEKELEVYRQLKDSYEEIKAEGKTDEKDLYEMLKRRYEVLVLDNSNNENGSRRGSSHEGPRNPGKIERSKTEILLKLQSSESEEDTVNTMRPLTRAESLPNQIHIGDVVRCKLYKGELVYYEGVIVENYYDGNFLVDFGEVDHNQVVNIKNIQKIMGWDELEIGDQVQVKEPDTTLYAHATVININDDGTYDVQYQGCDEKEDNLPRDRIRKIHTNRMTAKQRWKVLENSMKATLYLTKAIGDHHSNKHPHSSLANALLLAPSGKK